MKSQWIGVGVLLLVLCFLVIGFYVADKLTCTKPSATTLIIATETAKQLEQSLAEKPKRTYYKHIPTDTIPLYLHPFDPNTADSIELLQLGFRPWMARNLMKYRQKGGWFRTKESLQKIYGMNDELYAQMEPYIVIVPQQADSIQADSVAPPKYPVKKDTILELNTTDTAQLQMIRGVGRYTAVQIVRYRQLLGGYRSPQQLLEIEELKERADSLLSSFIADSALITPIPVNHASVDRLYRHPYLTFTQAEALYQLRRRHFRLHNLQELQDLEEFSEADLKKLSPYLSFED